MTGEQTKEVLSDKVKAQIDEWLKKYPENQKRSALLPALHIAQAEHAGWLSKEIIEAVALYLEQPPICAFEVATFYSMYDLEPVGKHKINVCTNISCMLRGSEHIAEHLKKRLGIGFGETTPDGKFTLKEVECLAACAGAPMIQLDRDYHENLTPEKIDALLEELK